MLTSNNKRAGHICRAAPDPAAPLFRLLLANWKSHLFGTIYQHNKHLEKHSVRHLCLLWNLPAVISLAVFLKTVYKTDYKNGSAGCNISDDGSLDRVGVISHMRNPLWKTILAEWWITHSPTVNSDVSSAKILLGNYDDSTAPKLIETLLPTFLHFTSILHQGRKMSHVPVLQLH